MRQYAEAIEDLLTSGYSVEILPVKDKFTVTAKQGDQTYKTLEVKDWRYGLRKTAELWFMDHEGVF